MPPKKKGSAGADKDLLAAEEVDRALILGDSFDQKFGPITLECPRTLLPLVNVPMLNYTIEFLAASGIGEIFVFCCSHATQIQEFLNKSKWSRTPGLTVRTVVGLTSRSVGDALREMDTNGLLQGDFVLVSGDVVSNMRLDKVLAAHKARRQKDKNCIMTMVLKKARASVRTRSLHDDLVVGIDRQTQRLIYFDNDRESRAAKLELELVKEHSELQFRADLIDCRIDICSPEVLLAFADNFDYQDLRGDFVRGIISSDVTGETIYTHVIDGEYAARVKGLHTYDSVSKDIVHRWTYPMVPDNNFLGDTSFSLSRTMVYKEKNVSLSRTSKIGPETVIGEDSSIGPESVVKQTVIGRNCRIGARCDIRGSYLWDNVTIEDDVVIQRAIICSGATVLRGSRVSRGCVLSYNVVVGPRYTVEEGVRLTAVTHRTDRDEDEDDYESSGDEAESTQPIDLGSEGQGRLWIKDQQLDTTTSLGALPGDEDDDAPSGESSESERDDATAAAAKQDDNEKFVSDAREILQSSLAEQHSIDNVTLEMNSLKYAFNANFLDCAAVILQVLLDSAADGDEKQLIGHLQKLFKKWAKLLQNFLYTLDDRTEIIWILQEYCETDSKQRYANVFPMILHSLFDNDVIDEEAIDAWADEAVDSPLHKKSAQFLKWLKEASSEEEDDDEEDDEEEDDAED